MNPYYSSDSIKTLPVQLKEIAEKCNEQRKKLAKDCRELWKKMPDNQYSKCYNGHITANILSLVNFNEIKIQEEDTIEYVLNSIRPIIIIGTYFIDNFFLPELNK